MRKATLPIQCRPMSSEFLLRLGKDNDGGYLVDSRDIQRSDCLISLGINRDWSFEKDFVNYKNVPVSAYDRSVNRNVYIKDIIKSIGDVRIQDGCCAL